MSFEQAPVPTLEIDLSPETYYESSGLREVLTADQFNLMWELAHLGYGEGNYHNFAHAVDTFRRAMEWADYYESQGVNINRKVLAAATLFHDDGYPVKPFGMKEDYSAELFAEGAEHFGFSEEETAQVQRVILDTKLGERPTTAEGVIMVMSDIGNTGGIYETDFMPNNDRFRAEKKAEAIEAGKEFNDDQFDDDAIVIISKYLLSIQNGPLDVSKFTHDAVMNLLRYAEKASQARGIGLREYLMTVKSVATDNSGVNQLLLRHLLRLEP